MKITSCGLSRITAEMHANQQRCKTTPPPRSNPSGGFSVHGGFEMAMPSAAVGGEYTNQFQQSRNQGLNAPVSPTISGAVGKVDGIGTRLNELAKALEAITDTVGGPRAVGTDSKVGQPQLGGVVNRLHDSADHAHAKLAEIESLVQGIQRMLG